jgi:hypothetical protein
MIKNHHKSMIKSRRASAKDDDFYSGKKIELPIICKNRMTDA